MQQHTMKNDKDDVREPSNKTSRKKGRITVRERRNKQRTFSRTKKEGGDLKYHKSEEELKGNRCKTDK